MASKLDHALALAAQGFKVFPVKPGAKAPPLLHGWPERASSDPETLRTFWSAVPDANIGIHCDGLLVVDIDPKNDGFASLLKLEMEHGELPGTLEIATPSGGRHAYFRTTSPVANTTSCLGRGIDVRSRGGYVVAAGSDVSGTGSYAVKHQAPIADAPPWLVDLAGRAPEDRPAVHDLVADAPRSAFETAQAWLEAQAPAVEGEGGDARTFAVACGLRDRGVSQAQAVELIESWNAKCSPPWTPREIITKVRNAYKYAQNEAGARVALPGDFPVVSSDVTYIKRPSKGGAQRLDEFASDAVRGPGYLVKGLLDLRSYAMEYGQPGQGKTFVALDIAYHVAAGLPWMDRKTKQGPVLYLAFEGRGGLVKRAKALRKKYGEGVVPLYVAGASMSLREPAGRAALGEMMAGLPAKPVLIVIDTFAHALMGGDENSAQDVGSFNAAVAALIENTGACVLLIHHPTKTGSSARGSSALLGAIDTELEIDQGQVRSTKQREVELAEPIGFSLTPVPVGMDEDGDIVTSCVVDPATIDARGGGPLLGNAKLGFDVLCEMSTNNAPVSERKWRDACVADFLEGKDVPKRFSALKRILRQKGYVEIDVKGFVTRRME